MSKNRFEEVDGPQDDAITLELERIGESEVGRVHCPAALTAGKLPQSGTSGDVPAKDAFRGAIKLANDVKAPLVVFDPHKVWQAEWGVLMPVADEGDEAHAERL